MPPRHGSGGWCGVRSIDREGKSRRYRPSAVIFRSGGSCRAGSFPRSPSLRGAKRRSNPECLRGDRLDCFASLAMTVLRRYEDSSPPTSRPPLVKARLYRQTQLSSRRTPGPITTGRSLRQARRWHLADHVRRGVWVPDRRCDALARGRSLSGTTAVGATDSRLKQRPTRGHILAAQVARVVHRTCPPQNREGAGNAG